MSANALVVVVIGPGGVGKGTVVRELLRRDDHLWLSRSWTTRAQRPSENGTEYYFVDRATFEAAIEADQFLEWAEFHGNLYGTPEPPEHEVRDLLLEIEVQGARQVREHRPDAVIFLITPPSIDELERRLRGRGDSEDHVQLRLTSTAYELDEGARLADFTIVNDDVECVTAEILSILEGLRRTRRTSSVKEPHG